MIKHCSSIVVVLWVFKVESGREHNSLVLKRQQERESELRVCISVLIISITRCIQRGLQS